MRKTLSVFAFVTALLFAVSAMAADKVVVIPLNSKQATTCTAPDEVLSQGQCWMDRNLGALRVAQSSTDSLAYGDYYQWGRLGDGHQYPTSSLNGFNSANDVPRHSDFILETLSPFDWRDPQNNNLWQGLNGINNPCPQGFRLPTQAEWDIELRSWNTYGPNGAFASPLKLVLAGYRSRSSGAVELENINGFYWSSTVDIINNYNYTIILRIVSDNTLFSDWQSRAYGMSVRCIKN